jgi:hypothetical protein
MAQQENRKAAAWRTALDMVEELESRTLLAASLSGGVLTVNGTAAADQILVRFAPHDGAHIQVVINNSTRSFTKTAVKQVVVNGGNGNDMINIAISARAFVDGGAGNDTLLGGGNRDMLSGGDGDDLIRGRKGDDQIYGDAGDDILFGNVGDDTVGGDDEDTLQFTGDHDTPNDVAGDDKLNGGPDDDWLLGGTESDIHNDAHGNDTLNGAQGADILDKRGRDPVSGLETGAGDVLGDVSDEDIVPITDVTGPIPAGEESYAIHQHAFMKIFIDGQEAVIPSRVGEFNGQPVFHTHDIPATADPRGMELHMHDLTVRQFKLGEFFRNWGVSLSSTHIGRNVVDKTHKLTMTVNGVNNTDFENYVMQDQDRIVINYDTVS